jgi:transcriptional regulator with XRE-family HTH domain
MLGAVENYSGMPKAARTSTRKLYLSEWLDRLGRRPVDLARHLGVGESYVSNLRSEKRSNPSIYILIDISEFLGVTVNDLFMPPPKAGTIGELKTYSTSAVERLLAAKPAEAPPKKSK